MSYSILNYSKQNDVQNNKKPENLHLTFETDDYGIFFVDSSDNTKLLKTTDEGVTVSTVETRSKKIARAYHDRNNSKIYFVDCEYDGEASAIWSVDYSNLDSIIEEDSVVGDVYDVFKMGSDIHTIYFSTSGYTSEDDVIIPDVDVTSEWHLVGAGTHHDAITDNGNGYIKINFGDGVDTGQHIDTHEYTTIDLTGYDSGEIYKIVVDVNWRSVATPRAQVYLVGNKAGLTSQLIPTPGGGAEATVQVTWEGLSLNNADLADLEFTITKISQPGQFVFVIDVDYISPRIYWHGDILESLIVKNLTDSSEDVQNMGATGNRSKLMGQMVVETTTIAYFLWKWSNEDVEIWKYDKGGGTITQKLSNQSDHGSDTNFPPIEQWALAYDESDIISYVLGNGKEEITNLVCLGKWPVADGEYITCQTIDEKGDIVDYFIWFDAVGDESGEPEGASGIPIAVDISGAGSDQDLSDALQDTLNLTRYFAAENNQVPTTTVIMQNVYNGSVTDAADVDSGITVAVDTQGTDNTYYYYTYLITDDIFIKRGEYNIALMMNRNTNSLNDIPFNLERGFDVAGDKLYQIGKGRGNLFSMSQLTLGASEVFKAITDTYLIIDRTGGGGNVELWQYVDFISYFTSRCKITALERGAWKADLWVKETGALGDFEVFDGLFLKIIGPMSSDSNTGLISYFGSPDNLNDVDLEDDEWYFGLPDDFNLETVGSITVAGDMDFIDTLTIVGDASCELLASFNDHNNVLALSMGTGTSNPFIVHTFPGGGEVTGTREFWWGTSNNTHEQDVAFLEGSPARILLKIDAGTFWYDDGGWVDTSIPATNDILFHHKIEWDCTSDTYDWYINEILVATGAAFNAAAVNIDGFYFKVIDDEEYTIYIDAFGDPAQTGYAEGDNLVARTRYGTLIPFVDSVTLPIHTSIVASWQEHKQPLKLTHEADALDPDFTHDITQITASTHEFYVGGTDTAEEILIQFKEDATIVINLKIDADNIYYESTAPAWVDVGNAVDDTFYHFKVIWRADNTFDVYLDGSIIVTNQAVRNNQVSGINAFYAKIVDNNGCSYYFDAYGDIVQTNYRVSQNLIKTDENAVIYEGYARWSDIKDPRKIWLDSPAAFDLKNKTAEGEYSGRTDQHISSNLSGYANYIVAGTMASGAALGTLTQRGRKSLKSRVSGHAQHDKFIWVIKPDNGQGLLNYNDGSIDSEVNMDEGDKLGNFKAKKIRNVVNQVNLKGALEAGTPLKVTKNNEASQQIYGIQPIYRTFANLDTLALLETQAQSILDMEEDAPFSYTFTKNIGSEGLVLPSETISLAYSPKSISSGQRIIHKLDFYFRGGYCKWEVMDAFVYTSSMDIFKQELEENTDFIEQLGELIANIAGGLTLFLQQDASDIGGYLLMCTDFPDDAKTDVLTAVSVTADDQELEQWATPTGCPAVSILNEGVYNLHLHAEQASGTKTLRLYFKVYKYALDTTETLIGTSENSDVILGSETEYNIHALFPATALLTTDRVVLKLYADLSGVGSNPTLSVYVEGTTLSRLQIPVPIPDVGAYPTAEHYRPYPFIPYVFDGYTAGNNNVYYFEFGLVSFGKDSKDNNHRCFYNLQLPDDFVSGDTETYLSFFWVMDVAAGNPVLDYKLEGWIIEDEETSVLLFTTGDQTFTGVDEKYNFEEIRINNAGWSAGDILRIDFKAQDDDNTVVAHMAGFKLNVKVNSRD